MQGTNSKTVRYEMQGEINCWMRPALFLQEEEWPGRKLVK